MTRLVLASASPRRRELLETLGVDLSVRAADIDETPRRGEPPRDYVQRLSAEKAAAVAMTVPATTLVIAADTTVDLAGRILGKPESVDDARSMLSALSGATHQVHTGVTVRRGDESITAVATTAVTFTTVTRALLDWYVATGEPVDKAGAYAIQGAGALLVERVDGSVTNVIGLPLTLVARLTAELGHPLVG